MTQLLGLLELALEVEEALSALGDPLPQPITTERSLRSVLRWPAEEQRHVLRGMVEVPVEE